MTFPEAKDIITNHITALRSNRFFIMGGDYCIFMGLIAAPSRSSLEFKMKMYEYCVKSYWTEERFLSECGVLQEDMNIFMIYMHRGQEIIIPFSSYLHALKGRTVLENGR